MYEHALFIMGDGVLMMWTAVEQVQASTEQLTVADTPAEPEQQQEEQQQEQQAAEEEKTDE